MKKLLLLSLFVGSSSAVAVEQSVVQIRGANAEITVLVDDQDQAVDRLVQEAAAHGGYFRERSATGVVARIPTEKLDAYMKVVQGLGTIAERKVSKADLSELRTRLQSGVASREEMLKRYLANMGQAKDREDLQTIQAATGELIAEIEKSKGSLRVVDHDARYAEVDVSFKLRDRTPVRISRETRFAWLSSVGLNQLLNDFTAAENQ